MNYISRCFAKYDGAFTESLKAAGFSADHARQFVTTTVECVLYTIKHTDLKIIVKILLSEDPSRILNLIDIEDLTNTLAMNPVQVNSGMEAISPVMKLVFIKNSNEIVDAAASLAWSSQRKINSYGLSEFINTH